MAFHAHGFLLAIASKVFEKQLLDNMDMGADHELAVHTSHGTKHRVVLVGLGDQVNSMDATEPFMRLVYGQELEADTKAQPLLLLQIFQLADQVEAKGCMAACAAALAALPEDQLQPPHISYVLQVFDDTDLAAASPDLQALRAKCEQRVVQVFGDACRVVNDKAAEGLREQFCSLSFAAVLSWVSSPAVSTDSENTILALLNMWCTACPRPQAQMQQLAAQVRVAHLSPLFTPGEVCPFPWFQRWDKLHLALLAHKHGMPVQIKKRLVDEGCPRGWLIKAARPLSPSAITELVVELNEEELREGIEAVKQSKGCCWESKAKAAMGIDLVMKMQLTTSCRLGVYVTATQQTGLQVSAEVGHSNPLFLKVTFTSSVRDTRVEVPVSTMDTFMVLGDVGQGFTRFLPIKTITSVSDLAPWIKDGKLVVKARLEKLDLQQVRQARQA